MCHLGVLIVIGIYLGSLILSESFVFNPSLVFGSSVVQFQSRISCFRQDSIRGISAIDSQISSNYYDLPALTDALSIAKLLADPNENLFAAPANLIAIWSNKLLLEERIQWIYQFNRSNPECSFKGNRPHFMFVARSPTNANIVDNLPSPSTVLGFIEIGITFKDLPVVDEPTSNFMSPIDGKSMVLCIGNFVVAQSMRRRGIGSQLLARAIEAARSIGNDVYLEVEEINRSAIELYTKKFGFEFVQYEDLPHSIIDIILRKEKRRSLLFRKRLSTGPGD